MAKADHVPVIALESVDEQLAALSRLPVDQSLVLIRAVARSPQLNDDGYMTMLQLYLRKEPTLAVAVLDAMPGLSAEERAAETAFTKQLLVGRNATMVERAQPLLAAKVPPGGGGADTERTIWRAAASRSADPDD